jgi:membrane protein
MPRGELVNVLKQTWSEFSKHDCAPMAAALAYYAVFSLPAALLIVLKVAGAVLGERAGRGQLQVQFARTVGPRVGDLVGPMIERAASSTTGGVIAVILGVAGLWWAATNITTQLQAALNRAWSVKPKEEGATAMRKRRFLSFLLIVGVGVLVLIALAASTAATAFSGSLGLPAGLVDIGQIVVTFLIFAFLFGAVYEILPDAHVDWRDVRAGAFVTAALFVAGKFLIGLYPGHSSAARGYGVVGSMALLLLWTYYSSMILLLGAEFTQVWTRRHGKSIEPTEHAVRVVEEERTRLAA